MRGLAVTVTHGPRELADFLDQPAEGTVFAPLPVAGTIDDFNALLELAQMHAGPPNVREHGNGGTRERDPRLET